MYRQYIWVKGKYIVGSLNDKNIYDVMDVRSFNENQWK